MLKFSEFLNFLGKIPILKEFEWFEWFGPSPIEPFNSGRHDPVRHVALCELALLLHGLDVLKDLRGAGRIAAAPVRRGLRRGEVARLCSFELFSNLYSNFWPNFAKL